jgi:hypothetical protein
MVCDARVFVSAILRVPQSHTPWRMPNAVRLAFLLLLKNFVPFDLSCLLRVAIVPIGAPKELGLL